MSLRSIFSGVIAKLRLRRDDSVDALAEELYTVFTSDEPIVLSGRIVIHNPTNGPAITIVNTGEVNHEGVEVVDKEGRRVTLGIGHGSSGIYASNIQYRPEFKSDPDAVQELLSQLGERGGKKVLTPDSTEETPGAPRGPGVASSTGFTGSGIGSGYTYTAAGSGVPGLVNPGSLDSVPVPGVGEMLGSIQRSTRDGHGGSSATHAPDAGMLLNLNGKPLWWCKDLHGWSVNRATVNVDYGDWLECTRYDIGDTVNVTKPYSLQKTPFDGKTVGGVTYSYTNNQCRTATSSSGSEVQVVSPPYLVKSGYSEGDVVYIRWVSNGTNVVGAEYIDVNSDARAWVVSPTGCTTGSEGGGDDPGGESCPGGSCTFEWDDSYAVYNLVSTDCLPGFECPEPPLSWEGDELTLCCMPSE